MLSRYFNGSKSDGQKVITTKDIFPINLSLNPENNKQYVRGLGISTDGRWVTFEHKQIRIIDDEEADGWRYKAKTQPELEIILYLLKLQPHERIPIVKTLSIVEEAEYKEQKKINIKIAITVVIAIVAVILTIWGLSKI
jgi:hypothetical protein